MKKLYFIFILWGLTALSVQAQWQPIYPVAIEANDVFFTSEQTGYVVGSLGGRGKLIKTTNGGVNWQPLSTAPASTSTIRAVWFVAADTGYVLTEYQVLKTVDAGASWQLVGDYLPNRLQALALQFTTATTGFLTGRNGVVYKTMDAGLTWQDTQVPATPSSYGSGYTQLALPTPDTGYLISDFELFKTTDAGASWQRLPGVNGVRYRSIMFRSATEGYVVLDFGGTYRTTDGGATWTPVPAGWRADRVYFADAQRGLFLANYSEIYRTSDGGATAPAAYKSEYTFSWNGLHFPTARFGCAVGNNGAIVITHDGGSSWRMHNPGTSSSGENQALYMNAAGDGLVAGEAPGLLRSPDGGRSWYVDEQTLPAYRDTYGLYFTAAADTGLVVTTNNYFYLTYDGGRTIQTDQVRAGAFVGHRSATDYLLLNGKTIFTTGSSVVGNGRLAKSTDGGSTWRYTVTGLQNVLASLCFPTARLGYACGSVGKILRTTDAGEHWQEIDAPVNNDLLKIQFRTPTFGLAVGTYGSIVRTTDGGTTWKSIPSGIKFPLIAIHFVSDSVAYVGSTVGELARTADGGRSWQVVHDPAEHNMEIRQYAFRPDGTLLAMGRYSLYRYELPDRSGGVLSAAPGSTGSRAGLRLVPNPATAVVSVQYPPDFRPVRVLVYDLQGRVVWQRHATSPAQLREIPLADLAPGLYVLRAENQQHSFLTQRLIKQ